jgi:rhodanese-related sulfurtransferase
MSLLQNLFGGGKSPDLKTVVEKGAFLVDVREPAEFAGGTAKGAVNIPLGSVASELTKFKGKENIVVFCRSGNRSGQAKTILEQNGFRNVINGGTWEEVNQLIK